MHSLLVNGIANLAGSVADSLVEFLFVPRQVVLPQVFPTEEQSGSSPTPTIPSRASDESGLEMSTLQVIGALRNKVEALQQEVYFHLDTMAHGMKILGYPCGKSIDRKEFLKQLWTATYEKDHLVAESIAVARTLQEEVKTINVFNVHLRQKLGTLKGKLRYLGIDQVGFWDAPDSSCRRLIGEQANLRGERESLIRQNRYLLAIATRQIMQNYDWYASLAKQ